MQSLLVVSSVLLWVVLLFTLLLTLAIVKRFNQTAPSQIIDIGIGKPAPKFTAETLDHDKVTIASFSGRNVAFIFISSHCSACRETLSGYETLKEVAKRSGIDLVLVNFGNMVETRALVNEFGIHSFTLVVPDENSLRKEYKVNGTPSYCLIDTKGIVRSAGFISELEKELRHKEEPKQEELYYTRKEETVAE